MHRKLRYVSKRNKLVQLVVQIQYHVNVIYSLRGRTHIRTHARTHAHTHTYRRRGQKQLQETIDCIYTIYEETPGLKIYNRVSSTYKYIVYS